MGPMVVPLADGLFDLLRPLIPIVILIIWVLSQVFGAQVKRAPPAKRPPPGPPPRGRGPVVPPKSVADEIEEFLKRATAPPAAEKADVDVLELAPPPTDRPAERPLRAPLRSEARAPMDAEAVEQAFEEVLPTQGGVADSVASHLGEHRLADRAKRLGKDVRAADASVRQRLHHTFDHGIGRIKHAEVGSPSLRSIEPSEEISQGGTPRSPLARLLRNRDGIRQAIILREILERPEHRW